MSEGEYYQYPENENEMEFKGEKGWDKMNYYNLVTYIYMQLNMHCVFVGVALSTVY